MAPLTRQEYCDAREQILENSSHVSAKDMESNVRIVKTAGEIEKNWVFLRGCFSELRSEIVTTKAHPNQYLQDVREALWNETRLKTYPLGSRVVKKIAGYRRGQQEIMWGSLLRGVEPLPSHLIPFKEEVSKAYANLDNIDDPRVGVRSVSPSPEPSSQHSTSPQMEGDRERPHRSYRQQIHDIVLMNEINGQIANVGSFCRDIGEETVLAACQRLIAALGNFRRQYTLWIRPDTGSSRESSRVVPENSINEETKEPFDAAAGDA